MLVEISAGSRYPAGLGKRAAASSVSRQSPAAHQPALLLRLPLAFSCSSCSAARLSEWVLPQACTARLAGSASLLSIRPVATALPSVSSHCLAVSRSSSSGSSSGSRCLGLTPAPLRCFRAPAAPLRHLSFGSLRVVGRAPTPLVDEGALAALPVVIGPSAGVVLAHPRLLYVWSAGVL